jgi:FdhD protein
LTKKDLLQGYIIAPNPDGVNLTKTVEGLDHFGNTVVSQVIEEKPLTIYLNSQEIVTAMTIGDYPEYLAVGFLTNQGMLDNSNPVKSVDFDEDLSVVIVRTETETSFEEKLKKKTRTSGCAVGTVFGDMMEGLEGLRLPSSNCKVSWLYNLSNEINQTPSLYLAAGAIHGTVICKEHTPLVYMEDVGRHNAVDKVAGWMASNDIDGSDKILYTTGRLTSEMVIKTAQMGIPILVSRSGFTAWGVEIADKVGMTLIGRMRGRRFTCLAGFNRLIWDMNGAGCDEK